MANEITTSTRLIVNKGSLYQDRNKTYTATFSGTHYTAQVQAIGTSAEAITIGSDVATAGMGYFVNLDTTNYVEIGQVVSATFYPIVKLKAGESAVFRVATTTLYARANTSAVDLEYLIYEN